jgi:hypothetical protein
MSEQPKSESSAGEGSEPKWMSTLRRSWPVAILVTLVAVFAGIKDISEGYEKLLVTLHLKPAALDRAQDTARGQFSDNLTRAAWKRLFWTRRYASSIEFKMSEADIAEIWEGYMAAVEEWNDNIMVNILGLRHYYGNMKRIEFEDGIVPFVNSIHECILKMRFPAAYKDETNRLCKFPRYDNPLPPNTQAILGAVNSLNSQLYCFVTWLDTKGESCKVFTDTGYQIPKYSNSTGSFNSEPAKKPTERQDDKR